MRYEDFEIEFGARADDGTFPLNVRSKAGERAGILQLPDAPWEDGAGAAPRTSGWRHVGAVDAQPVPSSPREIGSRLFQAVFRDDILQGFSTCWGRVSDEYGKGLRIQLVFDPTAEGFGQLTREPWELLYRPDSGFLARSRQTPVLRRLKIPNSTFRLADPAEELKVLVVTSNPEDTDPLKLDMEYERLRKACAKSPRIRLECACKADDGEMRERLLRGDHAVLHFMGHGVFDETTGEGALLFEDEGRHAVHLPSERFAERLQDCQKLQLVVLNACSSGRSSGGTRAFSGVASALVHKGLPAVLAMNRSVQDRTAIAFATSFYGSLAQGDLLEAAVVEGRQALKDAHRSDDWATPILFQRGEPRAIVKAPVSDLIRESSPTAPQPERVLARWLLTFLVLPSTLLLSLGLAWSTDRWPFSAPEPTTAGEPTTTLSNPSLFPAIASLQAPPYEAKAARFTLALPSSEDTALWRQEFERVAYGQLGSYDFHQAASTEASWLATVDVREPQATPLDGGERHSCRVDATIRLFHRQEPHGEPRHLSVPAAKFQRDTACRTAVRELAKLSAQYLGDEALASP